MYVGGRLFYPSNHVFAGWFCNPATDHTWHLLPDHPLAEINIIYIQGYPLWC
jgi:hypothetical protein